MPILGTINSTGACLLSMLLSHEYCEEQQGNSYICYYRPVPEAADARPFKKPRSGMCTFCFSAPARHSQSTLQHAVPAMAVIASINRLHSLQACQVAKPTLWKAPARLTQASCTACAFDAARWLKMKMPAT